jgi:hypothetical protein
MPGSELRPAGCRKNSEPNMGSSRLIMFPENVRFYIIFHFYIIIDSQY